MFDEERASPFGSFVCAIDSVERKLFFIVCLMIFWGIMADILVRLVAGDDQEKSFFLSQEFSSDVARLSGVVSRAPPAAAPEPGKRGRSDHHGGHRHRRRFRQRSAH
ncbi:MAG: hypothetical protein M3Z96_07080, partial [Pseudomonadota bacterium]|nr:hypothetical protein [Pseudomonadota bacterium]